MLARSIAQVPRLQFKSGLFCFRALRIKTDLTATNLRFREGVTLGNLPGILRGKRIDVADVSTFRAQLEALGVTEQGINLGQFRRALAQLDADSLGQGFPGFVPSVATIALNQLALRKGEAHSPETIWQAVIGRAADEILLGQNPWLTLMSNPSKAALASGAVQQHIFTEGNPQIGFGQAVRLSVMGPLPGVETIFDPIPAEELDLDLWINVYNDGEGKYLRQCVTCFAHLVALLTDSPQDSAIISSRVAKDIFPEYASEGDSFINLIILAAGVGTQLYKTPPASLEVKVSYIMTAFKHLFPDYNSFNFRQNPHRQKLQIFFDYANNIESTREERLALFSGILDELMPDQPEFSAELVAYVGQHFG